MVEENISTYFKIIIRISKKKLIYILNKYQI